MHLQGPGMYLDGYGSWWHARTLQRVQISTIQMCWRWMGILEVSFFFNFSSRIRIEIVDFRLNSEICFRFLWFNWKSYQHFKTEWFFFQVQLGRYSTRSRRSYERQSSGQWWILSALVFQFSWFCSKSTLQENQFDWCIQQKIRLSVHEQSKESACGVHHLPLGPEVGRKEVHDRVRAKRWFA